MLCYYPHFTGEEPCSEQLRDWPVITELVSIKASVLTALWLHSWRELLWAEPAVGEVGVGDFVLQEGLEIHSFRLFSHRRWSCSQWLKVSEQGLADH